MDANLKAESRHEQPVVSPGRPKGMLSALDLARRIEGGSLTPAALIENAIVPSSHLGLFLGRRTLATTWSQIAGWLLTFQSNSFDRPRFKCLMGFGAGPHPKEMPGFP